MSDINVYIYPNTQRDDGLAQTAKDAVETGLEDVTSNTEIESYDVEIRDEYPNLSAGSSFGLSGGSYGFFQDFQRWRDRNGFTETGCHQAVSQEFGGGLGSAGQVLNAFTTDANCIVGGRSGREDYFRNAAIHEVCHTLIDPTHPEVAEMVGQDDEHTLGMVYEDRTVSPMLTGYARRGLGNSGQCSNDLSGYGYTTKLSSCTLDAIEITWNDRTGDDQGIDAGTGNGSWWGNNDGGSLWSNGGDSSSGGSSGGSWWNDGGEDSASADGYSWWSSGDGGSSSGRRGGSSWWDGSVGGTDSDDEPWWLQLWGWS